MEQEESTFICLNPYCRSKSKRIFYHLEEHSEQECLKWIVYPRNNNAERIVGLQEDPNESFTLPLSSEPVSCIVNSSNLFGLCLERLDSFILKLKSRLEMMLE